MSTANSVLPTAAVPTVTEAPSPVRSASPGGPSNDASQSDDTQTATRKRAAHPLFVVTWSLEALRPKLPLRFVGDARLPLPPKLRYRSEYRYLGSEVLFDPTERATLSQLQIVLYIVDFSGLQSELGRGYLGAHKGQVPFHPVSMFLANCLRLEDRLSWRKLAHLLAGRDGGHWRQLLGFAAGRTPSASGRRYFYHHVMSRQTFESLCQRLVTLLRDNGLVSTQSTYPGDPPGRGISVTQDGMLHLARHRDCCQLATDECFLPLAKPATSTTPLSQGETESGEMSTLTANPTSPTGAADECTHSPLPPALPRVAPGSAAVDVGAPNPGTSPGPLPTRPCRARQHGHEGCRCDAATCTRCCRRASQLDPDARFQHYAGNNHKHGQPDKGREAKASRGKAAGPVQGKGTDCFGYRSVADRQLDDRFAAAWTLQSQVYSANTDERTIFRSRLAGLWTKYPDQQIGEWIDDSGVGYEDCLGAIYELGALRMVEIRAVPEDDDPASCLKRGYDAQGRPLCPFGYPMRPNGYDYRERRAKWVCAGVCRRQPLHEGDAVSPVKDCPFLPGLGDSRALGRVVNVGQSMPDGATRLARDIPYGSAAWDARYGRRNNSESRNSQVEGMGLKRMISYGIDHVTRDVQLADFILNLRTVGRLVREATALQGA